ncbi:serpin family protein [Microbacterium sp.]|uniref:serpin family protein n=1 Tax=Microbacterium sp. TaxID=51671 RepID=UPI003A87A2BF
MRPFAAVVAVVSIGMLSGCASSAGSADAGTMRADVDARTVALADAPALAAVANASRVLGMAVLAATADEGNTVVSPSSLQVALSMLSEGARGVTLAELETALGGTGAERRDAFAALRGALAPLDGDPKDATGDDIPDDPIVHLADQVVIDEGFTVDDTFLETLADVYDAGVQQVDLGGEEGKKVLDAWVNHHTGGLIPQSAITPDDRLRVVFQDSILLAARWERPFDPNVTSEQPFTLSDGQRVDVDTMRGLQDVAYAEVDGWRAARLPYVAALHADVILPPEGTDPAAASPGLLAALDDALDAATAESVELAIPVIDTSGSVDVLEVLGDLGIGTLSCSAGNADLSGIAGTPGDLCVSQATQQAVLRIDEEGTVAAAVTELGAAATGARVDPPHVLRLDRPFLFQVTHNDTNWMLFTAAVRDPRA